MSHVPTKTYDNLGLLSGEMPALLPTTMIPIQLRDPADIELARHAVESGELIGLTPYAGWAQPADPTGADSLAMLAQIADLTELQDGRVLLLLRGIERIRILNDVAGDASAPFRTVRAERCLDAPSDDRREYQMRRAILGTLLALASIGVEGADVLHRQVVGLRDPGALADHVGARILMHPAERFGLFRETEAIARLRRVEDHLSHMLVQHSLATNAMAVGN
jgi:Lon protease-like protein